jgi:hypothetical protein
LALNLAVVVNAVSTRLLLQFISPLCPLPPIFSPCHILHLPMSLVPRDTHSWYVLVTYPPSNLKVHSHLMLKSVSSEKSRWHLMWHPMLNGCLFTIK